MFESRVVAGGRDDFVEARHLLLRGKQSDVGAALALEAASRFGASADRGDPSLNRARREWLKRNWPEHWARMAGMAYALDVDPTDEAFCVADLTGVPNLFGCSAVWCPPALSEDGRGRIVRNFDFGGPRDPEVEVSLLSTPYVIESVPTDGRGSLVITGNNLANALEGVNEDGLCVVVLAMWTSQTRPLTAAGVVRDSPFEPQVGLHEGHVPLFVLDRCATAADARRALSSAPQYVHSIPCHYLIADRADAFVWEHDGGQGRVVECDSGRPLIVTNYSLCRNPDISRLPDDPDWGFVFARARVLAERTKGASTLSVSDMYEALEAVRSGTNWCSAYEPIDASLTVEFTLGTDESERRSEPATFWAGREPR